MKTIIALLIIAAYCFICSCSPLKDHYIKKYCHADTIAFETVIHDTIVVDSIQVDTVFDSSVDSVFVEKDKIQIQYIKKFGKIYLQGKCKGDTIYYEKKVLFEVPCLTPSLSSFDAFMIKYKYPIIIIIALMLLLIFKQLK